MHVSRRITKFIKTGQKASSRRLPIIEFQNEIIEKPHASALKRVRKGGEGGGSSNGLLEGGWEKVTHLLSWQSLKQDALRPICFPDSKIKKIVN